MKGEEHPLPPGWQRQKIASFEVRDFGNGPCAHVFGWRIARSCGCSVILGIRMDTQEWTTGVQACEFHGAHAHRVYEYMTNCPPSEQEIGQMFAEALEREIEVSPA